jgi:hypothetical protein
MRLGLALVLATLALAACGAEEPDSPGAAPTPSADDVAVGASDPRPPADPPPADVMADGPPPAWAATADASIWLAYATFCWESGCADYTAPSCGTPHAPDLVAERDETVTFGLGFEPSSASLVFFGDEPQEIPLEAGEEIAWVAEREGPAWLSARAEGRGDAAYAMCVRFAVEELTVQEALERNEGEVAVTGNLYADADGVRLCDGLAESYPPQCPRFLRLEGFDLESAEGLSREGEIVWTNDAATVRGTLRGTTLVVTERR